MAALTIMSFLALISFLTVIAILIILKGRRRVIYSMVTIITSLIIINAIYKIALNCEIVDHSEDIGRNIGLSILSEAEGNKLYRINDSKIKRKEFTSNHFGFILLLRNGYSFNKSEMVDVIGYYIQSVQLPLWSWTGTKICALALFNDCHVELQNGSQAFEEISKWTKP